jgi:hypothetical protein
VKIFLSALLVSFSLSSIPAKADISYAPAIVDELKANGSVKKTIVDVIYWPDGELITVSLSDGTTLSLKGKHLHMGPSFVAKIGKSFHIYLLSGVSFSE